MFVGNETIAEFDAELAEAINAETRRQEEHIELIASENYASPRTMEAQGSVLTNKYAEGYPGKRYYGGCEHVDKAEVLAIERAKTLFGADFANVQPHSGSQANAAVYLALLEGGDTVLGMSLADGGHLTHGATVNFSGKLYNPVQYGIDTVKRHREEGGPTPEDQTETQGEPNEAHSEIPGTPLLYFVHERRLLHTERRFRHSSSRNLAINKDSV